MFRALVFAAALGLSASPIAVQASTYNAARWVADLQQIKQILAERAPNLEWSVKARGLDLVQLAADTEQSLNDAESDADAKQVIRDFLGAFGDGHISIQWPEEKENDGGKWGTASICRSLGYADEQQPEGLPFQRTGGQAVTTPDSHVFPITILSLPAGRMGVLRIPSFYEWGYYEYCPQAVEEVGLPADGECDEQCGAAVGQRAAELLTEAVARQIGKLKELGVDAVAVDITQNGGGSLWLDPIARMLTPVKLKAPHLAFTRTDSWRTSLKANLDAVNADLANPITSIAYHKLLTEAKATLEKAVAEANKDCDRSGVWTGEAPTCSLLADDLLRATGVLEYAAPGELSLLSSASALFFSSLYTYQEGLWSGPLYVIMDEGSASAAEHFATLLKDNGAAVLIGEPTFGAGCGWMSSGDAAITLSETRAELHVPDCQWTRENGANEVAGIEPDLLVPWHFYDNAYQKAQRLVAMLQSVDPKTWHPQAAPPHVSGKPPQKTN